MGVVGFQFYKNRFERIFGVVSVERKVFGLLDIHIDSGAGQSESRSLGRLRFKIVTGACLLRARQCEEIRTMHCRVVHALQQKTESAKRLWPAPTSQASQKPGRHLPISRAEAPVKTILIALLLFILPVVKNHNKFYHSDIPKGIPEDALALARERCKDHTCRPKCRYSLVSSHKWVASIDEV